MYKNIYNLQHLYLHKMCSWLEQSINALVWATRFMNAIPNYIKGVGVLSLNRGQNKTAEQKFMRKRKFLTFLQ